MFTLDALCERFVWIVHLEWFLGVFPNYQNPILNASTIRAKQNYLQSGSLFVLDVPGWERKHCDPGQSAECSANT
jgi:hypothetical protein